MVRILALHGLPSWRALSRDQRRFVWQNYVHPQLASVRVRDAKMILCLPFIVFAYRFGAFSSLVPSLVAMIVIVFVIPDLMESWLVTRHRQEIEKYIQGHMSELQSLA